MDKVYDQMMILRFLRFYRVKDEIEKRSQPLELQAFIDGRSDEI